jgi:hypothetical protein
MNELIKRIKSDIESAKARRDAFEKDSNGYAYNQGEIVALSVVLYDIQELRLTDES